MYFTSDGGHAFKSLMQSKPEWRQSLGFCWVILCVEAKVASLRIRVSDLRSSYKFLPAKSAIDGFPVGQFCLDLLQ